MKIVFEDVRARVASHEELIGGGTGNHQSVKPGQVVVEAGGGIVFSLPPAEFQKLVPGAVYDPDTRRFTDGDTFLDPWTPEG